MKTKLLVLPLLTLLVAAPASAQERARIDPNGVVLVTPEGDLLDYVPEQSDVIVKRNNRGQRVLIDHYGNIVATEMPARAYFNNRLPGVDNGDQGGQDYSDNNGNSGVGDPDYFPRAPQSDDDVVTGTVQGDDENQQGFDNQPLPGDGVKNDNLDSDPDVAALEQTQPTIDERPLFPEVKLEGKKSKYEITAIQVFLDREGASPGVIDGKMGSNVTKAVAAFEQITGEKLDPNNSEDIMTRLGLSGGLPVMDYTITAADAAGPYVASIPEDYSVKATLPAMSYTSVTEALSERFHMDENYLKELNPGKDFTMPGTVVKVINPGLPKKATVARIVADKARKQVFAYGPMGELVAAFPASIGSSDTPSPSGIHKIERIALDPNYTYNPKINFQQGQNTKVLTIPPGPNGPVGTVWIALDKPTYGIHGTPDPSRIGKTQSHGCIRLTNWDANELAKMVKPGVEVEFTD